MAFCTNCGKQLDENAKFCLACGTPTAQTENSTTTNTAPVEDANTAPVEDANTAPVEDATIAPVEEAVPAPAKASGVLNMGMLVWAIINLISCCTPLGIAGLILTILAKDAPSAEEEAKKIKTAKTCNLIGTIGGFVYIVFCVIIGVIMGLAEYL